MSKAFDIGLHVSEGTEHENSTVLNRITADQNTAFHIQQSDTSRCVPRKMDNLQFAFSEIQNISLQNR